MEQQLQHFIAAGEPSDLTLTYSDMHGLWGGVTITLAASGAYERQERKRGAGVPEVTHSTVTPARIRDVVRLLIEIKAWEQHTPERMPVPDEGRATLMLRFGEVETALWEWYNDLAKNARLVRVRSLLLELAKAPAA